MIVEANHRPDARPGDPKVGGHPAAATSCAHLLGALHLAVRRPGDVIAGKPHAAPMDHALSHLLGLLRHSDGGWLDEDASAAAMHNLRRISWTGEPVFQSYHGATDPDHAGFIPSGSVGIPPVVGVYVALAQRFARARGWEVPDDSHVWALIGDSELREGSLAECLPDAAERELGSVTWIVDYNRQSLDGHRLPNHDGLRGTDADRIRRMAEANGWDVLELRHGARRRETFRRPGGDALRTVLEDGFTDYELQVLLLKDDADVIRDEIGKRDPGTAELLDSLDDDEVRAVFADLGGHDIASIIATLQASKQDPRRPCLVIAHTIKGFGLTLAAKPGNHSALPSQDEVRALLAREGLQPDAPYELPPPGSPERDFLERRGAELRAGLEQLEELRRRNSGRLAAQLARAGPMPESFDIDLGLHPRVHTQWMWGQVAARLVRIGTSGAERDAERPWQPAAALCLTLSPDVGTSTNINPTMNGRVFAPAREEDLEGELEVADRRRPRLVPAEDARGAHLRFDIAEADGVCAMAALGWMRARLGVPLLPMMTVYDFFIKRALDQLYYALYWGSEFLLVGTPSGVTLSPEGAQHSWKSDLQIPNLVTWEPCFAVEMDWILADAVRRHVTGDNAGRTGVLVRAVTAGLEQKLLLERLRRSAPGIDDGELLARARRDALAGAYRLVDRRGEAGYEPGDDVVTIFAMGAPVVRAVEASDRLEELGIMADVVVVTSPDLLLGGLAERDGYAQLEALGIDGHLHLRRHPAADGRGADLLALAGGRVPAVAVVDGEPGLLDNIGSIVGIKQRTLGVRRFSKSGGLDDVYRYHGLDAGAIVDAARRVLAETAIERVDVAPAALDELRDARARGPIEAEELLDD